MKVTMYAAAALVLVGALTGCAGAASTGGPVTAADTSAATATQTSRPAASQTATPVSTTAPARPSESGLPAPAKSDSSSTGNNNGTDSAEPGTSFTAYGQSVAWRAVVDKGVLTTEGPVVGERKVEVERSAFAKGVDFTGKDGRTEITLTVQSGSCIDSAGDTGMKAILSVGDRRLQGCAVEGGYELTEN
ncbi:MAG: hypothetical protein Q4G51_05780 [Dermatophilus congolensis]|nr:hypothetical protein [Dermatophilus congolensis]